MKVLEDVDAMIARAVAAERERCAMVVWNYVEPPGATVADAVCELVAAIRATPPA
jgi:hypothetical protein